MPSLKQMDLDALAAARRAEWDRLDELGRSRSLSGAEADELIDRYQSAASDLSAIRTTAGRVAWADRLSVQLSRARMRFTGAAPNPLARASVFFVAQLPAALYRVRWWTVWVAVAFTAIAVAYALWAASSPELMAALGSDSDLARYSKEDFVQYYSEYSGTSFTSLVWTNNAWIAAQCIAFGILGVVTPAILFSNAQGLGITAAVMHAYDRLDVFFIYISPHGLLELTAIFVAGATGMRIFWAWIAPGPRTRGAALAAEGRAMFTIVIGLALALLVSGVIEGFVTRQDWPWPVKTGIGALALAGFLSVQWGLGRRAARAGETGDLEAFEAGAQRLVAG